MKWDYDSALAFLKRLGITPVGTEFALGKQQEVGLGSWGALDFLKKVCGFMVRREKA